MLNSTKSGLPGSSRESGYSCAKASGSIFVRLIREETVQDHQEERTKPAFGRLDRREPIMLQQSREEFLGQVLGVVRAVPAPPDVRVKGIPIGTAEPFEGFGRLR